MLIGCRLVLGIRWCGQFGASGPWTQSPEPVYTENVTLVNGSAARFRARQRPQLVFAKDGFTPTFLFNAGSFDGYNFDYSCFGHTYAFAFSNKPYQ